MNDLIRNFRWLQDSSGVTFLWDDGVRPPRVVLMNLRTHSLETLTGVPNRVLRYDISRDGQIILFAAESRDDRSMRSEFDKRGFAVNGQSIWALLQGDYDRWAPWPPYEMYISFRSDKRPHKVAEPGKNWLRQPEILQLSPDGRFAVAIRSAVEVPVAWDRYTGRVFKDIYLPAARRAPDKPNFVRQYYVVDVQRGTARPLWDAPEDPHGRVVWSPDSRSVVVGPTFLPVADADAQGLSGRAVACVDVRSGQFVQLPIPSSATGRGYQPVSWTAENVMELVAAGSANESNVRVKLRRIGDQWTEIAVGKDNPKAHTVSAISIELRQDPNTPPALYAVDTASGRERLIRDINPQLQKHFSLGRVELVHWKASDGRQWTGTLYYPIHYDPSRRFPLVIQTHGYFAKEYSLDGPFSTVFAAQPLANRGIAVLQTGDPDRMEADITGTPREPQVYMAGFEGAVEEFVAQGLADRQQIGIIGFSRTGWLVEYMLTHSQIRLAAAEVADNIDGSYLQFLLAGNAMKAFYEADKEAAPFGKKLEAWMREAPGFNTDRIRTPLRMEIDSGPIAEILTQWEAFSNLQRLRKPVELFVVPNIEHGAHILQNPAQRLASQGGTVDWFCFWLKGEEDHNPVKADQYIRWRQLRKLQKQSEALSDNAP
jgi:dipeptidyl aminopeptidase/acylaminoacyl peptidase